MSASIRLLVVAGLLVACARPGATPPRAAPGSGPLVIERSADLEASARLIAARARSAEVLYLGELHDNPLHHEIQARVLAALVAAGGRPAVAFEMVAETQQADLDAAVRSDAGVEQVERRLRWRARGWPEFSMYWPILALARERGLPVVGLDLDPALTRRVSREGLEASGDEAPRLRSALPADPARDLALARRIEASHCNLVSPARAARMVDGWYARNVVIARRLAGALETSPQAVVIVGRGHQSPGGVPEQLAALRPGTRQLVVALAEEPDTEPDAGPAAPTADIVWLTPRRERPDPCRGLQQRLGGGAIERSAAAPSRAG